MRFYDPHAHTGDVLMACYFAREVARRTMGARAAPTVSFRLIGETAPAPFERTWRERIINDVREVSGEAEANARAAPRDALKVWITRPSAHQRRRFLLSAGVLGRLVRYCELASGGSALAQ